MSAVMTIAEVRHHAHVAPMTNGSRKVRYIENNVPPTVITPRNSLAQTDTSPEAYRETDQANTIATYPTSPKTPTGNTPKSLAHSL